MFEAPAHWLKARLDQVGVWRGGGTPSKSHTAYWADGTVPWVSPKDVKQSVIDTAIDKVTERAVRECGLHVIPPGSLLFVTRSGILARTLPIALTTAEVVINQDIKAFTPIADIDAAFLMQQLSYMERAILEASVKPGTTVESIGFEALKATEILLPPLSEQRAISEQLSEKNAKLNETQDKLSQVVAMIDSYEKSILLRALLGKRQSKSAPSPSWNTQTVTLGEIAEIGGGLTLGKRNRAADLISRPYLRVANVQRGRLELDDVRSVLVTPADADRHTLMPGDILMNEGGDPDKLGRGWVWEGQIEGCLHQNHVFRVRLKDPNFPAEFISLYANEIGRDYFLSVAKQTTNLASISRKKLAALPIHLPSADQADKSLAYYKEQGRWITAVRVQTLSAMSAIDGCRRAYARKAFQGRLAHRAVDENSPDTSQLNALLATSATEKTKRAPSNKGSAMKSLEVLLKDWPKDGITFEDLRQKVPSEYDVLKDALFVLLAGTEKHLEQRYDSKAKSMRLYRRKA